MCVINRPTTAEGEIICRGGGGGKGDHKCPPYACSFVCTGIWSRKKLNQSAKKKRMWEGRKTATKHEIVRKLALKLLQSQTPQKHFQACVWISTCVDTNTNSKELGSFMFQNPPWIPPPPTPACLSLSSASSLHPIWMFYSSLALRGGGSHQGLSSWQGCFRYENTPIGR